ncbi:TetR/AcrR family transcriptional regulator [Candidatus Poriferisocius sp.]|uniref:TetR/AcrR family transcriptional regulator n=1 Tax=Candidatus Poriferisocius sp. TaxID=3101276 RepID=UPI003B02BF5A
MSDGAMQRRVRDPDGLTERLLDAAAEVFVEQGYDKGVVSDIARRAGATTGAIYARWPDKNEMMVAALNHLLDRITPEQRLKDLGVSGTSAAEILAAWGANLLESDGTQDVLVQIFGSARNNAAVQQRLQEFLNLQADQLCDLVERAKDEGLCDREMSTPAMVLLIQAAGIGTHLLLSADRAERHVPTAEDWVNLLALLLGAVGPPDTP